MRNEGEKSNEEKCGNRRFMWKDIKFILAFRINKPDSLLNIMFWYIILSLLMACSLRLRMSDITYSGFAYSGIIYRVRSFRFISWNIYVIVAFVFERVDFENVTVRDDKIKRFTSWR